VVGLDGKEVGCKTWSMVRMVQHGVRGNTSLLSAAFGNVCVCV
jgi:hypothetical protein